MGRPGRTGGGVRTRAAAGNIGVNRVGEAGAVRGARRPLASVAGAAVEGGGFLGGARQGDWEAAAADAGGGVPGVRAAVLCGQLRPAGHGTPEGQGFNAADAAKIGTRGLAVAGEAEERIGGERNYRIAGGYDGLVKALTPVAG